MELRQVRYFVAIAENLKCQADKQTPACLPAFVERHDLLNVR
jgi:hypothetical protein